MVKWWKVGEKKSHGNQFPLSLAIHYQKNNKNGDVECWHEKLGIKGRFFIVLFCLESEKFFKCIPTSCHSHSLSCFHPLSLRLIGEKIVWISCGKHSAPLLFFSTEQSHLFFFYPQKWYCLHITPIQSSWFPISNYHSYEKSWWHWHPDFHIFLLLGFVWSTLNTSQSISAIHYYLQTCSSRDWKENWNTHSCNYDVVEKKRRIYTIMLST